MPVHLETLIAIRHASKQKLRHRENLARVEARPHRCSRAVRGAARQTCSPAVWTALRSANSVISGGGTSKDLFRNLNHAWPCLFGDLEKT